LKKTPVDVKDDEVEARIKDIESKFKKFEDTEE